MTRIRFEDLPSTNTPRNAENLNKLNNVAISSSEPTTGEEVWLQKGKNLLNIYNGFVNAWYDINNGPTKSSGDALFKPISVSPSTEYTLSVNTTIKGLSIVFFDINKNAINVVEKKNTNLSTITTPDNCYYVRFWINKDGNNTMTNDIVKTLEPQFELGNVRTDYEPYIEKKIHTKNDNGVYEEFYNETKVDKLLALENFDNKVTYNSTAGTYHFTKQGKMVNINYRGGKVAHTPGEVLFVLPEGYRPVRNIYFFAVEGGSGTNQSTYIYTNGECKCDFEGNARIMFHISFATELGIEK